MNKNTLVLSLSDDTFNTFKSDFDQVLKKTIATMIDKGGDSAELTAKIKIAFKQDYVPDESIATYSADREIISPKFTHKVSSVLTIKNEASGFLGGDKYELIWDGNVGNFIMVPINNGEVSLFDQVDQIEAPKNCTTCEITADCGHCCAFCDDRCGAICDIILESPKKGVATDEDDDYMYEPLEISVD